MKALPVHKHYCEYQAAQKESQQAADYATVRMQCMLLLFTS